MNPPGAGVALSELAVGERAKVLSFELPPEQRQRFLEMGLTAGVEVQVVRFAPLGDPVELRVRGYQLSIRKHEAAGIRVART